MLHIMLKILISRVEITPFSPSLSLPQPNTKQNLFRIVRGINENEGLLVFSFCSAAAFATVCVCVCVCMFENQLGEQRGPVAPYRMRRETAAGGGLSAAVYFLFSL